MSDMWNEAAAVDEPDEREAAELVDSSDPEVSEPDLLEQRRALGAESVASPLVDDLDLEVPIADAWEQRLPVGPDDEY